MTLVYLTMAHTRVSSSPISTVIKGSGKMGSGKPLDDRLPWHDNTEDLVHVACQGSIQVTAARGRGDMI